MSKAVNHWIIPLCLALGAALAQPGHAQPVPAREGGSAEATRGGEAASRGAAEGGGAQDADDAPAEPTPPAEPEVPALVQRGIALREGISRIVARVDDLEAEREGAQGEDVIVLDHQIADAKLDYLDRIDSLVDNLIAQEREGYDTLELRAFIEAAVLDLGPAIVAHIDVGEAVLRELREQREARKGTLLLSHEQRIAKELEWLLELYQAYFEQIGHLERLELSASQARVDLAERSLERAERLKGRIEIAQQTLAELGRQLELAPSDADRQVEITAVELRKETLMTALAVVADELDALTIDSTRYRQLLVTARGQVTADVFRGRVALGLIEQGIDEAREWIQANGLGLFFRLLVFVAIVLAFRLLGSLTTRIVRRSFTRSPESQSRLLQDMMLAIASRGFVLLGILLGLSQLGVELGPLLAGLGIAGFIVGFALQDSLSNFAAGVMILAYRPFDVDDLIEAGGVFGRVSHMSLVSTTILTLDNQTLIVPNSRIWGDVIKNVTNQERRRVDMSFSLAYDADTDRAESILNEVLSSHPAVLSDPEPLVRLHKIREGWVEFAVRPWVETDDYWDVYWYILRETKRRFDEAGLMPGVPRQDVRVQPVEAD